MTYQEQELKEYTDFWLKVAQKAQEVQKDYNKLSVSNKQRVSQYMQQVYAANSVAEIFNLVKNPPI